MNETHMKKTLPTHSRKFWLILISLFCAVMLATLLKDYWLTSQKPNLFFYLIVPALTILSGVIGMLITSRVFQRGVPFLDLLAISLIVNTIMQLVEIILKFVYYLLWEYSGFLYILLVIPGGFLLMTVALKRWTRRSLWMVLLLTVIDFICGLAVGIFLTEVIGITTPGS